MEQSIVSSKDNGHVNSPFMDSRTSLASQVNSDLMNGSGVKESNTPQPNINETSLKDYEEFVHKTSTSEVGIIKAREAVNIFNQSGVPKNALRHIWEQSDRGKKGLLTTSEYIMAVHLIGVTRAGYVLPVKLPEYLRSWMQDYDSRILRCENASFNSNILTSKYINMETCESRYSTRSNVTSSTFQTNLEPKNEMANSVLSPNKQLSRAKDFNVKLVAISDNELTLLDNILIGYENLSNNIHTENPEPKETNFGTNYYNQIRIIDSKLDKVKTEMNKVCLDILKEFDRRVTVQKGLEQTLDTLQNAIITQETEEDCQDLMNDIHKDEIHTEEKKSIIYEHDRKIKNLESEFDLSQIIQSNSPAKLEPDMFDSQLDDAFGF